MGKIRTPSVKERSNRITQLAQARIKWREFVDAVYSLHGAMRISKYIII